MTRAEIAWLHVFYASSNWRITEKVRLNVTHGRIMRQVDLFLVVLLERRIMDQSDQKHNV